MDYVKKQDVALLRYTAIAPVVTGLGDAYCSNNDYYREISEKGVTGPDGKVYHFHPDTLQRWYSAYKKQGFEALMPRDRRDAGKSRKIDADLLEQLTYFVEHYPRMPATEILRKLEENGSVTDGQVSLSTITRCVSNIRRSAGASPNRDMRRYERPHINEVWCGDSSVGPRLKGPDGRKQRVYIIALIDDASRSIQPMTSFFAAQLFHALTIPGTLTDPDVPSPHNGHSLDHHVRRLLWANACIPRSPYQPHTAGPSFPGLSCLLSLFANPPHTQDAARTVSAAVPQFSSFTILTQL